MFYSDLVLSWVIEMVLEGRPASVAAPWLSATKPLSVSVGPPGSDRGCHTAGGFYMVIKMELIAVQALSLPPQQARWFSARCAAGATWPASAGAASSAPGAGVFYVLEMIFGMNDVLWWQMNLEQLQTTSYSSLGYHAPRAGSRRWGAQRCAQ